MPLPAAVGVARAPLLRPGGAAAGPDAPAMAQLPAVLRPAALVRQSRRGRGTGAGPRAGPAAGGVLRQRQEAAGRPVFKNGKPSKKEYRHFNIKTVEGPDDYASMTEVVYRRYKRLLDEKQPLPQLIIIDGGKGQLSAALKVWTI